MNDTPIAGTTPPERDTRAALALFDRLPAVEPSRMLGRWRGLRGRAAGDGFQRWLLPLLTTRGPQARLRRLDHRGITTAAMIYDNLPIVDVFRRLDEKTLLGLMDARGIEQPFFFLLRREEEAPLREEPSQRTPATDPESRRDW